jgi:hypothetical protein
MPVHKRGLTALLMFACVVCLSGAAFTQQSGPENRAHIVRLVPPEQGFFAKELDDEGIPIKSAVDVADEALYVARERLDTLLKHLPNARWNLANAGAELHIIGKDQVTSDLPEHRALKGKPFDGNLTVDQRTRGLGGLLTSCGEENLLKLPGDRYAGRDICIHEFAHNLQDAGFSQNVRDMIQTQYQSALAKGLWKGAYAATNVSEFWAELTMWYFGTHGDMNMTGDKPENGPQGLKRYDPESYALLDAIYSGRVPVTRNHITLLRPLPPSREANLRSGASHQAATLTFVNRTGREYRIYWLDEGGKRRPYGTLAPYSRHEQETFRTHVWLLAADDEKAIALFIPTDDKNIAQINGSN